MKVISVDCWVKEILSNDVGFVPSVSTSLTLTRVVAEAQWRSGKSSGHSNRRSVVRSLALATKWFPIRNLILHCLSPPSLKMGAGDIVLGITLAFNPGEGQEQHSPLLPATRTGDTLCPCGPPETSVLP